MDWLDSQVLSYDLFSGDRDSDITVFSNRMVRTRKPHDCVICRELIEPGSRVRAQTERDNDDHVVMTFYVCVACCEAIRAVVTTGDDGPICDRTSIGIATSQAARPSAGPAGGQPPAGGEQAVRPD